MIRVHGYSGRVTHALAVDAQHATVVVGGQRHLEALGISDDRAQVLGPLDPAIKRLASLEPNQLGVVVASGDPLLYGIARRLRRDGLEIRVIPAVSSVQMAFAQLALPWDDARIASAHGHGMDEAIELCRNHPKVAMLTARGRGLPELAEALEDRWFVLAERLGEGDQRVRILNREDARAIKPVEPNVVLVLKYHPDDPRCLGTSPAIQGEVNPS